MKYPHKATLNSGFLSPHFYAVKPMDNQNKMSLKTLLKPQAFKKKRIKYPSKSYFKFRPIWSIFLCAQHQKTAPMSVISFPPQFHI